MTYLDFCNLYDMCPALPDWSMRPPECIWYQEFFLGSGMPLYPEDDTDMVFLDIDRYPSGVLDGAGTHMYPSRYWIPY